jgi:hypothetical protein
VARRIAALVLPTDLLGAFLVAWLFLSKLIANDALIAGSLPAGFGIPFCPPCFPP